MRADDRKLLEAEGFVKVTKSGCLFILDLPDNDRTIIIFEHPKRIRLEDPIELSIYEMVEQKDFQTVTQAIEHLQKKYVVLTPEQIAKS